VVHPGQGALSEDASLAKVREESFEAACLPNTPPPHFPLADPPPFSHAPFLHPFSAGLRGRRHRVRWLLLRGARRGER
jgi:hypothetical protein